MIVMYRAGFASHQRQYTFPGPRNTALTHTRHAHSHAHSHAHTHTHKTDIHTHTHTHTYSSECQEAHPGPSACHLDYFFPVLCLSNTPGFRALWKWKKCNQVLKLAVNEAVVQCVKQASRMRCPLVVFELAPLGFRSRFFFGY